MTLEKTHLTLGFLPLTDCASLVVAAEHGLFRAHGLHVLLSRESSWASVRDKLVLGHLDAAHALYGLIYGAQLGIGSPPRDMAILLTLNQNGQGITLSQGLRAQGIVDGPSLARRVAAGAPRLRFAHTFPTGTHAMWLYYWLAAHGIDPLRDVELSSIPPPQMVSSLRDGRIDGCCVGEPWNARAEDEGLGFTVATSQSIWPNHPEKVLGTTLDFAQRHPATSRALIAALLQASVWIDDPANHAEVATLLARPEYIDAPPALILRRLSSPHGVRFHGAGEVNLPRRSHGIWFLTQLRRWGLAATSVDYAAIATQVSQAGLYREAAGSLGIAVPPLDAACETLFDGRRFDPAEPEQYLAGFTIHG